MGMFDDIRCEYPLPGDAPATGWQTKSTPAQCLVLYTITKDGRLLDEGNVVPDFHGNLRFYAMRGDDWWEFVARFTDGQLTRLTGGNQGKIGA